MPVNKFVKDLAKKLFDTYAADASIVTEIGELMLGKDKLAEGLAELIDRNLLKLPGTNAVTAELIETVIQQIKARQEGTGILKPDGVLGERTLHWIFDRKFGHHDRPKSSLPTSRTSTLPGDGIHALRYFIEGDRLPHVPELTEIQTLILFTQAWESWALVCKINVKQTGNKADANVIVNLRALNGEPKSVVAIADVGPPANRQLELTFDLGETWTPHKLQATAAHEIGHLLGLHHIGAAKQLMNDTLHDDIRTPQTQDIAAAVAIWGKR